MFQFGRFPRYAYLIQRTIHDSSSWRFPHSEIHGSRLICSSPWLIAACHVFLRLLMPRHSPCALVRLNSLYERYLYPLMVHSILSRIAESRFTVFLEFKLAYHRVIGKIVLLPFFYLGKTFNLSIKIFSLVIDLHFFRSTMILFRVSHFSFRFIRFSMNISSFDF